MGLLSFSKRKPLPIRYPEQAQAPALSQAELAAVYYGQRMGGDFYDFVRVNSNQVLFGLLDVAGRLEENHGIVNAAQQTFRDLGGKLFAKEDFNTAESMIELCLQMNRTILEASGTVHACPAFAGCYDESLGTITYFNAGHPPGLVRDHTGVTELPATGLPLGLFSHTTADVSTVALPPGAGLLLVSRGIVEAKCGGEEFGLESVKVVFGEWEAGGARDLSCAVLARIEDFMCTPPTHNDVTALSLVRATSGSAKPSSDLPLEASDK
jgi:serine phosphatase RsbU (regulator of sigma subunit)